MLRTTSRTVVGMFLGASLIAAGLLRPSRSRAQDDTAPDRIRRNSGNNSVPFINQPLSPSVAAPGGAAFTLTVNGTGFVAGAVVDWNGSPRATTFSSSSKLTASILASDIATASTASVTVVNPAPGGGKSNVCLFEVTTSETTVTLNRTDSGVGNDPAFVTTGDFNLDGKPDLAVTNDLDNTVSVLLGSGNGAFGAPTTLTTGVDPLGVAVGDFNNDGKPDLVVVNDNCGNPPCQPGSVSILLGNGNGTFGAQTQFTVGTGPVQVAVADFNGDGNLDLAVTNEIDDTVSILLGNGNGTFASEVAYACALGPISVAAGDFNNDGKLDLAVTGVVDGRVSILLGNGDGTFQSPEYVVAGPEPYGLVVADFNGDGILDMAVTNLGTNTVGVLRGLGGASFFGPTFYTLGGGPLGVAAGDFNGDGKLDLVAASHAVGLGMSAASILLGNGDATFQAETMYTTAANPVGVAVGDFVGNGRLDLVTANESAASISALVQPFSSPVVTLSPTSLTFPDQPLGITSGPMVVTLTNTGSVNLNITSIAVTGTNMGDFAETNTCPGTLAANASCTISVTFTPMGKNTRTANVTITDNALNSPQNVPLTGTGTQISLTPPSLNFGNQPMGTTSGVMTITVEDVSKNATVNITGITISGANSTSFAQTNNCPANLGPLATCTVSVTFTPQAIGALSATLNVNDNGGGSPQTAPLSGTGTSAAPAVSFSPTSLSFPDQPLGTKSGVMNVTLTNSGSANLTITNITLGGADPGDFSQTNTCPGTLAPNANCTISVTFAPTLKNTRTACVTVTDNASNSPQNVPLTGLGTQVMVSPSSVNFGNQTTGTTSAPMTVTVMNVAKNASVTITSINITGTDMTSFAETTTCPITPNTLGPLASCTVSVTFTPQTMGTKSATLNVNDNGGGSPQTAALSGTGT